eukprot:7079517-Prymnesium_polylepis.1
MADRDSVGVFLSVGAGQRFQNLAARFGSSSALQSFSAGCLTIEPHLDRHSASPSSWAGT